MLHATHLNKHEPMIPIVNLLNTFNPHTLNLHDQLSSHFYLSIHIHIHDKGTTKLF